MKSRVLLVTVFLCSLSFTSHAALVFTSQDVLPDGLSTLQDERTAWSSGLNSLVTEVFEDSFILSNRIDFDSFIVSITGSDFTLFDSNGLTRTQGNNGI